MKSDYTDKLERSEAKLSACQYEQVDIKQLLDKGLDNLLKLDYAYASGDIEKKRAIISSMFPEKMTFDGFVLRTTRINEAVRRIYTLNTDFGQNKNRTNRANSNLSCQVALPVQFSNRFLTDLQRLANLAA